MASTPVDFDNLNLYNKMFTHEFLYYLMRPDEALTIWNEKRIEGYGNVSFGELVGYFVAGVIGLLLIGLGIIYCIHAWAYKYISNGVFIVCMLLFLLGGVGGIFSVIIVFCLKRKSPKWKSDVSWKRALKKEDDGVLEIFNKDIGNEAESEL